MTMVHVLLGIPAMVLHECGHVAMAKALGVKVKKIGLNLKGMYTVREAGSTAKNLLISAAGPLVNLSLAMALRERWPYFAFVNVVCFVYNLLPIPNSDGTRILGLLRKG